MSDAIISVENLGKRYRLHHEAKESYTTLRDVLARKVKSLLNPKSRIQNPKSSDEDFWALKDVSFEVKQGEVVGIIGRNGAGKSTLLKILSRITEPTEGRITLRGRVASLLEVGTGFHPELTGRENIYLNGAILGMTKAEIRSKFDEIVAFAEVEKFLDTPVKRYSSGMYVRLAFAVAAHLEPEILVVDEVLAVGDAEFQKKCLGKMGEVARGGRTVLFVSHNMAAVQSLCSKGILLKSGQVAKEGSISDCVTDYLKQSTGLDSFRRDDDPATEVRVLSGRLTSSRIESTESVTVHLTARSKSFRSVSFDLRLAEAAGTPVGFGSLGTIASADLVRLEAGLNQIAVSFPVDNLANGRYALGIDVTIPFHAHLDRLDRCLSFDLERAPAPGKNRTVEQAWGYGSLEIPLRQEAILPSASV
jgi:lipopolysaccharide transport system ATP-binding protein